MTPEWTNFCHTVLPQLCCHLWMTWCYYYVLQVIFSVQETLKLLRQQTEMQQWMAVSVLHDPLHLTAI